MQYMYTDKYTFIQYFTKISNCGNQMPRQLHHYNTLLPFTYSCIVLSMLIKDTVQVTKFGSIHYNKKQEQSELFFLQILNQNFINGGLQIKYKFCKKSTVLKAIKQVGQQRQPHSQIQKDFHHCNSCLNMKRKTYSVIQIRNLYRKVVLLLDSFVDLNLI